MAQVSVKGRLVKVVAVDPATYRNFAPFQSADSDEVWQRVAGGEVAIDPERQDKFPADKDGFVRLGSKKDAASVHVGAYAPQPPGLAAAVVNHKWGEEMGMEKGNALIVSTAAIAPNRVVKPIQTVVGSDLRPAPRRRRPRGSRPQRSPRRRTSSAPSPRPSATTPTGPTAMAPSPPPPAGSAPTS